jgi:hypothetical protein
MLTAATVALLSGPAFGAAIDITSKTTAPLTSANDGPITLDTNGSIVIPSSSSATAAAAAIELNSPTAANNIFTSLAGTTLSFNDTSYAIGIQADPGFTGEIISAGAINLTGSGTYKNGIVFGDLLTSTTTGTFTGTYDGTNNPTPVTNPANPSSLTALYLQSGSSLAVVGDGSSDIQVVSGSTVAGDIVIAGSATDQVTTLKTVTNTNVITAINMAGTLNGNLEIAAGGSVRATGGSAQGVLISGPLNGSFLNYGALQAIGSSTLQNTTGNPEGGSALIVSNSITGGGIYNAGPSASDSATTRAAIDAVSSLPAVDITPGFGGATAVPITIQGLADPEGVFGTVSFLNRGTISGAPDNTDDAGEAVVINGATSGTNSVTLTNGLVNSGTISSGVKTDASATATTAVATALAIGNNVVLGTNEPLTLLSGTPGSSSDAGYALVNFNETNQSGFGAITATVSGIGSGTAAAIDIGATSSATNTNVPSLFNSGTISANALSTDPTISSLAAYGILDNSGSLRTIYNTGTISALTSALNNNANIARAISLQNAGGAVNIYNSGTITGDVLLGQYADTITVQGQSLTQTANLSGNIYFGGNVGSGSDTLTVGTNASVTGNILEQTGSSVAISVASSGVLNLQNNGSTVNNHALASGISSSLPVSSLIVKGGGTLDLTLSQAFNQQSNGTIIPVVQGIGSSSSITLDAGSILNLNFGSFVAPNNLTGGTANDTARFIIFDAPTSHLSITQATLTNIQGTIPFLFGGTLCASADVGLAGSTCTSSEAPSQEAGRSYLLLDLTPKAGGLDPANGKADAGYLGLSGYALKMFPLANKALANDSVLGAAVVAAGDGLTGQDFYSTGQKIYQGIYSAFAPDVTGASRAIAISITDQATGPVGARQRELRMYAGLDGDATLWGQEFGQRLNTGNSSDTTGYANTGFGFALGADVGDPHDGRYGGAFTFYTGNTSEKSPRTSKTRSEWVMLTGYSDWRGRGIFVDTQLSAAYGNITGRRSITIPVTNSSNVTSYPIAKCNNDETCTAQGKRGAALLAGGVTAGTIYHSGGTVFIPQVSIDGLAMREDGYTESTPNLVTQSTSGFDLSVKPYYAESLRAFVGADLRQDLKFGDYFVQPEGRAGFRYDVLNGAEKLKAEFACSTVATGSCGDTSFSITGPDPAKGNAIVGGGIAVTTGAWSLGLNYDYVKGIDGVSSTNQVATVTLIGRI